MDWRGDVWTLDNGLHFFGGAVWGTIATLAFVGWAQTLAFPLALLFGFWREWRQLVERRKTEPWKKFEFHHTMEALAWPAGTAVALLVGFAFRM